MIERYIVSAPTRVGGNLIADLIRSTGPGPVMHTHNPRHKTDNDLITGLIIVRRRDVFSAIMSNCIVWRTGQTTKYDRCTIDPFEITEQEFLYQYIFHVWHFKNHDLSRMYGSVDIFYFEDFVNNHMHVFDRLGLIQEFRRLRNFNFLNNAPYNYKQVIKNYQDLKILFDKTETEHTVNPYIEGNVLDVHLDKFH
jgi:hypothetical protein